MSYRVCVHHEEAPAVAICTDCGGDICGGCHGTDLRGFAICRSCQAKYGPVTTAWEAPETGWSPYGFAHTVGEALSSPRTFFARLRPDSSPLPAAVFGLICITVGTTFATIWELVFGDRLTELVANYSEQLGLSVDLARLSLFASIPFVAMFSFLLHVALFHSALRVFGAPTSLGLTTRIAGYACAAYAFLIIPPIGAFSIGHFLMIVWLFNLEVGAVRWFFDLGFWKSMGVVLIPFMFLMMLGAA